MAEHTYPVPTQEITADELQSGDQFPSHDELTHTVQHVSTLGEGESESVRVDVSRSDGTRYRTTFAPLDTVHIL